MTDAIKILNDKYRTIVASMTADETLRGHGPKHAALRSIRREITGLRMRQAYGIS